MNSVYDIGAAFEVLVQNAGLVRGSLVDQDRGTSQSTILADSIAPGAQASPEISLANPMFPVNLYEDLRISIAPFTFRPLTLEEGGEFLSGLWPVREIADGVGVVAGSGVRIDGAYTIEISGEVFDSANEAITATYTQGELLNAGLDNVEFELRSPTQLNTEQFPHAFFHTPDETPSDLLFGQKVAAGSWSIDYWDKHRTNRVGPGAVTHEQFLADVAALYDQLDADPTLGGLVRTSLLAVEAMVKDEDGFFGVRLEFAWTRFLP